MAWHDGYGNVTDDPNQVQYATNSPKQQNNGIDIDWKDALMSGGTGLLSYTLADQVFGEDGSERKKRNAFDRLLSKLIPIGLGGLGAYAGHRLSNMMNGVENPSTEHGDSEKRAQQQVAHEPPPWTYYFDYNKESGDPDATKLARPPVVIGAGHKPVLKDDGSPKFQDDWSWLGQNLEDYYRDAAIRSAERDIPFGQALRDQLDEDKASAWTHFGIAGGLGAGGGYSYWRGKELLKRFNEELPSFKTYDADGKVTEIGPVGAEKALVKKRKLFNEVEEKINKADPIGNRAGKARNEIALKKLQDQRNSLQKEIGELDSKLPGLRAVERKGNLLKRLGRVAGLGSIVEAIFGAKNAYTAGRNSTAAKYVTPKGDKTTIQRKQ